MILYKPVRPLLYRLTNNNININNKQLKIIIEVGLEMGVVMESK
jgi:hypothetical protein